MTAGAGFGGPWPWLLLAVYGLLLFLVAPDARYGNLIGLDGRSICDSRRGRVPLRVQ